MDYLEEKYKRNCLTPKELEELQRKVREMSDGQLEDRLFKGWQEDILDDSSVSAERLAILKRKVDKSIFPKYRTKMLISWGRIAAAILLPIFVFATFYFYQETRSLSSGEVLFSTFAEEHANLTLPDGTKVTMNSNSSLTYSPKDFNRDERCVDFNGEAYFNVAKNKSVPFVITTKDLTVRVLVTKFNLHAYAGNETMEVTLEEGEILVSSRKEEKKLLPNQKAVLNCQDGSILVLEEKRPEDASVWKNNELVFIDEQLENVIVALEENYNISIHIKGLNIDSDLFTGKVPSNDLLNALEILKYSYHMDYCVDAKDIYFSKK